LKLFRTGAGVFVQEDEQYFELAGHDWDSLLAQEDLSGFLSESITSAKPVTGFHDAQILAPISRQEVWAAGVTYYRSRGARME
jgi:2-dehydro-3-deoxy-D-arabinonate dehydratase